MHADAANTDYSPVRAPCDVTLAWERHFQGSISIGPLPWTINLGPTIDPSGRVYLTTTTTGCHLQAIDGRTGQTLWCAPAMDVFTVASSPLLDRNGRLYVADGRGMHAFDRDGTERWRTTIDGVPLSAQFTPDGRIVFVTNVGKAYVLDRGNGAVRVGPIDLAPGVHWDPVGGMAACARGTEDCPSANTIAVDPRGRVFFTFWAPGAEQAGIRAMRYRGGRHPTLRALWANDALPGGSASSPVVSRDGRHVYVTDNVDALHALDAATGTGIWSYRIGYASGGSPSISPDGLVIPAGGSAHPLVAVLDTGSAGVLAWQRDDLHNHGIANQTAGPTVFATVDTGAFHNDLVVLDARTGRDLDREPLPGTSVFSVGTTVGPDGTIYVPTIVGGLYAFRAG